MHILVQVKVGFLVECFATYVTFERFLTTVNAFVDLHVVLETKHLLANVTLVGFLTSVSDLMPSKLARVVEDNAAIGVGARVNFGNSAVLD